MGGRVGVLDWMVLSWQFRVRVFLFVLLLVAPWLLVMGFFGWDMLRFVGRWYISLPVVERFPAPDEMRHFLIKSLP